MLEAFLGFGVFIMNQSNVGEGSSSKLVFKAGGRLGGMQGQEGPKIRKLEPTE